MILLILALGFLLRIVNLNQSLWLDEAVQAIVAKGTLNNLFILQLQGDFHPPLYHLFIWLWVHLFGSSEVILRLPSVIFGTATIFVTYLITKQVTLQKFSIFNFKFSIAELAALLLAISQFHIYYSQEARPYALVTFLVATSFYFLLKNKWIWYILTTTLALYSSYFVLFVIIAQGIWIFALFKKQVIKLLYCYIVILFLFLPWIPQLLKQLKTGSEAAQFLPGWASLVNVTFWKIVPLTFIKFTLGRIIIFDKTVYALTAGLLIVIYGSLIIYGFLKKREWLIILWLTIPIISAWGISLVIPNYQPFRLLFTLPAFYLLLAGGISSIRNKVVVISILILISFVSFYSLLMYDTNSYFQREDWRSAVRFLEKQKDSLVIIPSTTSDWPWRYYSSDTEVKLVAISKRAREVSDLDLQQFKISNLKSKIYYIRYLQPVFDPEEKILTWLQNSGYTKERELNFNQISVWEYNFLTK